jgi:hypothetical protein
MFDELLYALFPYISEKDLWTANTEKYCIQGDKGLMNFLSGRISVPLDPQSTLEQSKTNYCEEEVTILIQRANGTLEAQQISDDAKAAYHRLKEILREKNAKAKVSADSVGEVPSSEASTSKKKDRKRKMNGRKIKSFPSHVKKSHSGAGESKEDEPELKTDAIAAVDDLVTAPVDALAAGSSVVMETSSAISSVSSVLVKTTAAPYVKPMVPMGGWSASDKERATAAASRFSSFKAVSSEGAGAEPEEDAYKFTPASPINISHTNYETLQALLEPTTPEFTISFDQVVHLLEEGLGIKVTRNGGSHAHMNTPGRNKKTLVDLHGGWTDKFNRTTMNELSVLMINLGLDQPENVIEGKV